MVGLKEVSVVSVLALWARCLALQAPKINCLALDMLSLQCSCYEMQSLLLGTENLCFSQLKSNIIFVISIFILNFNITDLGMFPLQGI